MLFTLTDQKIFDRLLLYNFKHLLSLVEILSAVWIPFEATSTVLSIRQTTHWTFEFVRGVKIGLAEKVA